MSKGWMKANPFGAELVAGVGRRAKGNGKVRLRIDEARTLMDRCLDLADDAAIAVLTALVLGTRASEVVKRTVRDLDDGGRLLWITRAKTHNGERILEVPPVLGAHLTRLAKDRIGEAPLFRDHDGERPSRWWLSYHLERICKLAGVPVVSPHALRRTHATLASDHGSTSRAVADALGHGSTAVTNAAYIEPNTRQAASSRRAFGAVGRAVSWEPIERFGFPAAPDVV